MNSQTLKTVGLYAGAALVGAAAGAIIGSLIVDQMLANENGPVQELEEEAAEEESEDPDSRPALLTRPPKERKMVKVDYTKFTKDDGKGGPDQLSDLVQKYAKDEESEDSLDMSRPYVISIEDFNETGENNAKVTLTYYEADDILTEADDSPIPDVEQLIGDDSLLKFGMNSDDNDVVYVRNTKISSDFEVIRVHRSYSETVLGVPADEKTANKKVKKHDEDTE